MNSILTIQRPWRYRDPKRGQQVMKPGRYRVPGEVPKAVADRAVSEGMGESEPVRAASPVARPVTAAAVQPKPKKTRKSRKKAMTYPLETKIINVAENKSGLG